MNLGGAAHGDNVRMLLDMTITEAQRAMDEPGAGEEPFTHWEALRLIVSIVETLFDDEVTAFSPNFHAQLTMISTSSTPTI